MDTFIGVVYELHFVKNEVKRQTITKVIRYITDNISDMSWQGSICSKVREIEEQPDALFIVLRLFHQNEIKDGKLKSFARYKKANEKLIIDQMLTLEDYENLPEDEMRQKLCDDIFCYISTMLKKYKERFHDFDAMSFIPLLKEQIEKTKNSELPYYEYGNSN